MDAFIYNYLISFPIIVLLLVIAVMLFTLSKGSDVLVDQAVSLSLHWGVSKMIIGATIVSLGTTLPETTISVMAAINGNPDLALGNAIGSIIANTGLIIGLASLMGHLPVDKLVYKRQGKIQIWAGLLLAFMCLPFLSGGRGVISQWVGCLFLVLLAFYVYLSVQWSKASSKVNIAIEKNNGTDTLLVEEKSPLILQLIKLLFGIILVIGSSKILIPAVEITAIRIGIPQSVIAATLIALGTSLPELVTAITAVKKGHGELAIGNVVGANILNALFVVGSSAAVTRAGLAVPINFYKLQIPTMVVALVFFHIFLGGKKVEITKKEGSTLLAIYLIYLLLNYT
ncbi:sodium:calcium antiporter [Mobilitalea sibirica]|uniref:Sodium:calcium antiporter n=1 Tax=Mobilitalea sibirica TaxID=1462919 RepID=A0A8J7H831_9FIRM|nr:sodium:calcium antiporter [Mobilitalea sibirica]MBH1939935.1 sodium:calcium antiporter [Mobilitalea sibirica]